MAASQLRLATSQDASAIAEIYAPFVAATHVSFEERPPSANDVAATLAAAHGIWPWIVCERADGVVGFVYASAHRPRAAYRFSVDTSCYVRESARRTGVARLAYGALFRTLAAQRYYNAFAGIALPNDASIAFHTNLGYREIARFPSVGFKAGAWRDTVWLHRQLRALDTPPFEPRVLAALDASEIAACLAIP